MLPPTNTIREQTSRCEHLALRSGIAYAALQLGAILFAMLVVVPTHAPMDAPVTEIAKALGDHAPLIAIGTYLLLVPLPLLLVFLGGLFVTLRRIEGAEAFAVAGVAAGVAAAVIGAFGTLLSGLTAPLAHAGGDPAVVTILDSVTPLAMALAAFPHAILLATTSMGIMQSGRGQRGIAYFGLVLAPIALLATGTIAFRPLFPVTMLEMLLFPLWILVLSVAMSGRRHVAHQTQPQVAIG